MKSETVRYEIMEELTLVYVNQWDCASSFHQLFLFLWGFRERDTSTFAILTCITGDLTNEIKTSCRLSPKRRLHTSGIAKQDLKWHITHSPWRVKSCWDTRHSSLSWKCQAHIPVSKCKCKWIESFSRQMRVTTCCWWTSTQERSHSAVSLRELQLPNQMYSAFLIAMSFCQHPSYLFTKIEKRIKAICWVLLRNYDLSSLHLSTNAQLIFCTL